MSVGLHKSLASLGLEFSPQADPDRAHALSVWTRDLLRLSDANEISVHELHAVKSAVPFMATLIGLHLERWVWYFTFIHHKEIVTKNALREALVAALCRDFGVCPSHLATGS